MTDNDTTAEKVDGFKCYKDGCDKTSPTKTGLETHVTSQHPELRPYTDKETMHRLRHEEGLSNKEIAEELECKKHHVDNWMPKLDIPRVNQPWQDKDTLQHLCYDEGKTYQEMADELGCSRTQIAREMKSKNIQPGKSTAAAQSKAHNNHASFYTDQSGYERWQSTLSVNGEMESYTIRVHQLLAIHKFGFDAVCGNDVHHGSESHLPACEIPWANWEENLQIYTRGEHIANHNQIDDDELLEELRRLERERGEIPLQSTMRKFGKYSTNPYNSHFNSWTEALKKAGLDTDKLF